MFRLTVQSEYSGSVTSDYGSTTGGTFNFNGTLEIVRDYAEFAAQAAGAFLFGPTVAIGSTSVYNLASPTTPGTAGGSAQGTAVLDASNRLSLPACTI